MVEHLLAKEGVAGSIPVSRFFYAIKMGTLSGAHFYCIIEPNPGLEGSISRLPPRSLLLCFANMVIIPLPICLLFFYFDFLYFRSIAYLLSINCS